MSYIEWIRRRIGNKKVFLVFATLIVEDAERRILLQQRTDFTFWGLPGGAMELGEDIQTTARRELEEETGLKVGALRLVGVYSDPDYDVIYPNGDAVQQFTVCFAGRAEAGPMLPDGVETSFQAFVTLDEALQRDLPPWYRQMLADFVTKPTPTFRPPFAQQRVTDQVKALRPFFGCERLILVGGSAVVRNERGDILLVKRRDSGAWVLPAGYTDIGENVAHTAVREVREETGLNVDPIRIIGVYSAPHFGEIYPNGDQVQNVGVLFDCRCINGTLDPDSVETKAACWVDAQQLPKRITPRYRLFAEKIVACLNEGHFVF